MSKNDWNGRETTLLWINGEIKEGPRKATSSEFNKKSGARAAIRTVPNVFEPGGGRGMDLYSHLLDKDVIHVWGQVDEDMAQDFISRLKYLEIKHGKDSNAEIEVIINSPGGSVIDGMAMFNAMMQSNLTIRTTVNGMAASMGAFLLNAGDKRSAFPESRVMIHQPSSGTQGKVTDQEERLLESQKLKTRLTLLMTRRAQQANPDLTFERMWDLMERDTWLNAKQAKELGLVDEVVMPSTDYAPHRTWLKDYPEVEDVLYEPNSAIDPLRSVPRKINDPSEFDADRSPANQNKKQEQPKKKAPQMKP